jgi:hypothetical protein
MNWISAKNTNTEFEKDVEFRRKSKLQKRNESVVENVPRHQSTTYQK